MYMYVRTTLIMRIVTCESAAVSDSNNDVSIIYLKFALNRLTAYICNYVTHPVLS